MVSNPCIRVYVLQINIVTGKLQLPSLLTYLSEMGIRTLMVEGGARVIDSFMRSGLVKHLIVTISPCFVGPDGIGYEGHDKVRCKRGYLRSLLQADTDLRMRSLFIKIRG